MTRPDDLLPATVPGPPPHPASPADPVAEPDASLRRRAFRRRLAVGSAAAAVLAVVALTLLIAPRPDRTATTAATATAVTATAVTATAATATTATAPPSGSAAAAQTPTPPVVLALARSIAGSGRSRVDNPVEWVHTTLGAFWRLAGFSTNGDPHQQVYVVQLHGSFCCHPGPPGVSGESSVVFEAVPVNGPVGSRGGGGMGAGLDLIRLGTVHTFSL